MWFSSNDELFYISIGDVSFICHDDIFFNLNPVWISFFDELISWFTARILFDCQFRADSFCRLKYIICIISKGVLSNVNCVCYINIVPLDDNRKGLIPRFLGFFFWFFFLPKQFYLTTLISNKFASRLNCSRALFNLWFQKLRLHWNLKIL